MNPPPIDVLYSLRFVAHAIDNGHASYMVQFDADEQLLTMDALDMLMISHEVQAIATKIREKAMFLLVTNKEFIMVGDDAL